MKDEINLLPYNENLYKPSTNYLLIIKIIAIVSLIIVAFSSVAVFLFKANSSMVNLRDEEQQLILKLAPYNLEATKYSFLSNRLREINDILSKRPNFNEKVDVVFKNLPADASIDSISIDQKKITIGAVSNSLSSLNIFLDNLVAMVNNRILIKRVVLNGVNVDRKQGKARVSLEGDLL